MKLASQKTLILEQTVNLVIPGVNLAILAWLGLKWPLEGLHVGKLGSKYVHTYKVV